MAATPCIKLPHTWTEGDVLPEFEIFWDIEGGISGFTITLVLDRPTTQLIKPATIVDADSGAFKFAWVAGDLVTGDDQEGVIQVLDGSGNQSTWDLIFLFNVREPPT